MLTHENIGIAREIASKIKKLREDEHLFRDEVVHSLLGRMLIEHLREITKYPKEVHSPEHVSDLLITADQFLFMFSPH